MPPRPPRRVSLRPLEPTLVGAWIACLIVFWVAAATHRSVPTAATALDAALRVRIAGGEVGIAFFLILLLLRRGEHGVRLLLPFVGLTLALCAALWLAPDLTRLQESLAALEPEARTTRLERLSMLRSALVVSDATRIVVLFALLTLEIPWRGSTS